MPLGKLLDTNERYLKSRRDTLKNSFSILNRLDLDRPLLLKEKLLCVLAEDDGDKKPKQNANAYLSIPIRNSRNRN